MAYNDAQALLAGLVRNLLAMLDGHGERLFKQKVIPELKRRHRMTVMLTILRTDKHNIRDLSCGEHLLSACIALLIRQAAERLDLFKLLRAVIRRSHDLHLLRESRLAGSVCIQSARTAAGNCNCDGFHLSFLLTHDGYIIACFGIQRKTVYGKSEFRKKKA